MGVPDKVISVERRTTRGAKVLRIFRPHPDKNEDLTIDPQDLQNGEHDAP
jgi:hypothetical protein